MNLSGTRTAAVVGGGIGGLAVALRLRQAGWDVEVLERAPELPRAGTALGLWPSALRALDALGLGDAVRATGRAQAGGAFLRADGSTIAELAVGELRRGTGDGVRLLSRPALLGLLGEAVRTASGPGSVTLRLGEPVPDVTALRGRAEVLVAADGAHSRARTALFGPRYAARSVGVTAWHGTVGGDVDTVTETWGARRRFGITPQEGGVTNWFACAVGRPGAQRVRESADREAELRLLRGHFGDWHGAVRAVLGRVEQGEGPLLRRELHTLRPPLPSYVRDGIALIGDAAHVMTPDLGRGACEALVDGVTLADCLVRHTGSGGGGLAAGLRAYDAERRRPTQRLARQSLLMNRMVHAPVGPARNAVLRGALALGGPPV
ncbi:FAD-dependent monooxygenase [Streptomyces sp. HNM0574]|uniref:FAD-dependent monooxygenase n=1 Tax=Streptomyces sp. HNM0574 TaxID=2714954 RepID=UPI00146AA530|nr:FAD-dependent monooxygenase [Streptomyces sp. HNM0574]NLU69551.1 NAD(P)-binding protein [Streptomyces sp. HNM0574]